MDKKTNKDTLGFYKYKIFVEAYEQILEAEKKRYEMDKEKEEFLKTYKGPVKFDRIPLDCTNKTCRCKSRKKENEGLK